MAKNLEVSFLLDFYGEMLTQKQHDFLVYYYDEDLSLSEIAENAVSYTHLTLPTILRV